MHPITFTNTIWQQCCLHPPQAQLAKEEAESERLAHLEEQERRDHELALRLATETNSAVEEMTPSLKRWVGG